MLLTLAWVVLMSSLASGVDGATVLLKSQERAVQDGGQLLQPSPDSKYELTYGTDLMVLWYWYPTWSDAVMQDVAEHAVKRVKADVCRVAILCRYQLYSESVFDANAYEYRVLPMMRQVLKANPHVKFFATPEPLSHAFTKEEKEQNAFNNINIPWTPFPLWVGQWYTDLDIDHFVTYYITYLRLMKQHGFVIHYMDVTNEKVMFTAATLEQAIDKLGKRCADEDIHMPLVSYASTWSMKVGTEQFQQPLPFSKIAVASAHNTDAYNNHNPPRSTPIDDIEAFVAEAHRHDLPAWNNEIHGWVVEDDPARDDIVNSLVVWEHLRAGVTGLQTWLFLGNMYKGHSMVYTEGNGIKQLARKFHIFELLTQTSAGGVYLHNPIPAGIKISVVTLRRDLMAIWLLSDESNRDEVRHTIKVEDRVIRSDATFTTFTPDGPPEGNVTKAGISDNGFDVVIPAASVMLLCVQFLVDASHASTT